MTYLYFSLTVSAIAALYFISQNWKNQLVLQNVRVYDARILTDQEVKTIADVSKGSPLFHLSLAKISRRVEQNPFVKEAVVVRALPYDLSITVRERNPIALVSVAGTMSSVDENGVILPVPLARKNNLPLITNVTSRLRVGDTARGSLIQAVRFINDAEKMGQTLTANIAEIRIENGNLVVYTTALSLPVLIGTGDYERKLLYLQKFMTDLASTEGSQSDYIDLRFAGQIVLGMMPDKNGARSQSSSDRSSGMLPASEKPGKAN